MPIGLTALSRSSAASRPRRPDRRAGAASTTPPAAPACTSPSLTSIESVGQPIASALIAAVVIFAVRQIGETGEASFLDA